MLPCKYSDRVRLKKKKKQVKFQYSIGKSKQRTYLLGSEKALPGRSTAWKKMAIKASTTAILGGHIYIFRGPTCETTISKRALLKQADLAVVRIAFTKMVAMVDQTPTR